MGGSPSVLEIMSLFSKGGFLAGQTDIVSLGCSEYGSEGGVALADLQAPLQACNGPSLFQQPCAFLQFRQIQLGHEPIRHTGLVPVDQVVSLTRQLLFFCGDRVVGRPDKQINEVLASLVNQSRNWAIVEVVQAAAD